jgi:hypothetical protein
MADGLQPVRILEARRLHRQGIAARAVQRGYDQGGQRWRTWYMFAEAGKVPHGIERQADGTIKVEETKTTKPPSYPYERLGSWHGGVVDIQLNHASKWDALDAYMYPHPGIKHAYAGEPKE